MTSIQLFHPDGSTLLGLMIDCLHESFSALLLLKAMTPAVVDADHLAAVFDVTMTTDGMTSGAAAIVMVIALETVIVMVTGKRDLRDEMRGVRNEVRKLRPDPCCYTKPTEESTERI